MGKILMFMFLSLISLSLFDASILQKESEILDDLLRNYDKRIRPSSPNVTDGPVTNTVNLYIRLLTLNDVDSTVQTQITFRQSWNDPRLKYDDLNRKIKYVTLKDPSNLWVPDIFFSNEIKGYFHGITVPNVLIRIYPDGNVIFSIRITLRLNCLKHGQPHFPSDKIICDIKFGTYGYTTEEMILRWKNFDPIQISKRLQLPNMLLEKVETSGCTSKTNTGDYSCLGLSLTFHRHFNYYLVNIYIPTTMLVIMTWIAFWLRPTAILVRLVFTAIPFMTAVILTPLVTHQILPKSSNVTAIEIWTGMCISFIFTALILVAFINNFRLDEEKSEDNKKEAEMEMKSMTQGNDVGSDLLPDAVKITWYEAIFSNSIRRTTKADYIARITFPCSFILFNFIYWLWLLAR